MTPARRKNLERLLRPRHVALIGGRDSEVVAGECKRIGYDGPVSVEILSAELRRESPEDFARAVFESASPYWVRAEDHS